MVNYQQGKIYKIVTNTDDDICYVGSTTNKYLCQRMTKHKNNYKVWKNGKTNNTSSYELFEKYGFENCRIELLEIFPCNSRDELTKKEAEYIRALNCVNKVLPDRTVKEWYKEYYDENKETLIQYQKEYRIINEEKVKKRDKIHYEANKIEILEKAKKRREANKNEISIKRKIYYQANKIEISERNKKWHEANKIEISERGKQKYTCSCGSTLRHSDKLRHEKSKKHIEFITSQDNV